MDCSTPGFSVLHYPLGFAQTHFHWVGAAIQPPHPLSPVSPPALNLSHHQGLFQCCQLFPSGGQSTAASASARVLPMNNSGLISFRIDWFDLPAVLRTLKSLLWHHSSKASILCRTAFFIVQLSHLYATTGKTKTLTIWTFVSKVMSLLFNMLSRFVTAFLPRSVF